MTYTDWTSANNFPLPQTPNQAGGQSYPLPPIKAISIKNPYAWQIITGEKPIEYRTWYTSYRGWLAIISSKRPETGYSNPPRYPGGHILGIVTLYDVQGYQGDYEWLLHDPHPLPHPIPMLGRLGLYSLPPEIERAIMAEIRTK